MDAQQAHDKMIDELKLQLDGISPDQLDKDKTLDKLIGQELARIKRATTQTLKSAMGSDPRQAYKAIRVQKYKKIFGGNINILNGKTVMVNTAPRAEGVRHRSISARTQQVDSYWGVSRAFILRFINVGTHQRTAGTRGGRGGSGNRGSITAKHFMNTAHSEAERTVQNIQDYYELLIDKKLNQ